MIALGLPDQGSAPPALAPVRVAADLGLDDAAPVSVHRAMLGGHVGIHLRPGSVDRCRGHRATCRRPTARSDGGVGRHAHPLLPDLRPGPPQRLAVDARPGPPDPCRGHRLGTRGPGHERRDRRHRPPRCAPRGRGDRIDARHGRCSRARPPAVGRWREGRAGPTCSGRSG